MTNILRFKLKNEWIEACVNEIISIIENSQDGGIRIALSGGSTPIPIYKRIGAMLKSLPSEKTENIRFLLVDERDVSLDSKRSNSRMILNTIGQEFVIPFDPAKNAPEEYNEIIGHALGSKGVFDLVVLGCGSDGHTASLFPNTTILQVDSYAFLRNQLPTGEVRFSMTYPLILDARKRVIFVNNNSDKLRYFTSIAIKKGGAPIHKVLTAPSTKAILHETL